MISGNNFC